MLRNGELINTVVGTSVIDKKLNPNTEYTYTVRAVDAAGNISEKSEALVIKTTEENQIQKHQLNLKDYTVWELLRVVLI